MTSEQSNNISRKAALNKLKDSGKKIAFTALPLSLVGLTAKKSSAQFQGLEIGRALNFILQIEFMQETFYVQTITRSRLIPQPYKPIFQTIRKQHQKRVILIKNIIASLEIEPAPQLRFNFRINNELTPFRSFYAFLDFAQIIEDTAAGVYKKQAENICQNNASRQLKRTIMRLHSTESRHAYYARYLRAERGLDNIKGWINQANLGTLSSEFENIYRGEGTTTQEEVDIPAITDANTQAIQEAWDEPIGRGAAESILQLFTRPL